MWYVDGKINGILQNWLDVWIQGAASFLHQGITESGDLMRMIIRKGKILWMLVMFIGINADKVDLK